MKGAIAGLGLLALAATACGDTGKEGAMTTNPPVDPVTLLPRVEARLAAVEPSMIAVRHDIHRHPELSGRETRTAGLVADRLKALGLSVRTGVGGHGVVARLDGARPGRSVGIRADMDAVPSNAHDPADFRSEVPGVRHICGHDVHVATALATAEGLAAVRDSLPGSVVFYFQPAEENVTGAWAMLNDGALDGGKPDVVFAYHTAPFEVGVIGTMPGMMLGRRGTPEDIARGAPGTAPGVDNDPAVEARTRPLLRAAVGDSNVVVLTETIPGFSEDFGHFQSRIPGVMFLLGVSDSTTGVHGMPHADDYQADDRAIRLGARVMAALVLHELR